MKHAEAAENELSGANKQHASESVKHLNEAIEHAKQNHADEATKHVSEALIHLQQSTGS